LQLEPGATPAAQCRVTASEDATLRAFVVTHKQLVSDGTSYETYEASYRRYMDAIVACRHPTLPNLVAFPEGAGLVALLIGSRGEKARSASDSTAAFVNILKAYQQAREYFAEKYPSTAAARQTFLALHDVVWRTPIVFERICHVHDPYMNMPQLLFEGVTPSPLGAVVASMTHAADSGKQGCVGNENRGDRRERCDRDPCRQQHQPLASRGEQRGDGNEDAQRRAARQKPVAQRELQRDRHGRSHDVQQLGPNDAMKHGHADHCARLKTNQDGEDDEARHRAVTWDEMRTPRARR
jgi:hypothetical protein